MKSAKASLSYIVLKSNTVYSQRNKLSLLIDSLSEEDAAELHEVVKQKTFQEGASCIAKFFKINKLQFDDNIIEDSK